MSTALNQNNLPDISKKAQAVSATSSRARSNMHKSLVNISMTNEKPINYRNGKKIEPVLFSYTNYYKHHEKLPQHFHPLIQFLENTDLKYHNDNLHENTPIGFPTRAQLLKEKVYHLPILKDTPAEKARFRRKIEEKTNNIASARKKYDFKTYDNHSSHYFLTGARFNRNDTIDSKILNKYGVFVNRNKPDLVYIKSNAKALESFNSDLQKMEKFANENEYSSAYFKSKSVQVSPNTTGEDEDNDQFD